MLQLAVVRTNSGVGKTFTYDVKNYKVFVMAVLCRV